MLPSCLWEDAAPFASVIFFYQYEEPNFFECDVNRKNDSKLFAEGLQKKQPKELGLWCEFIVFIR
jgi:hypothetical protein